MEPTRLAQTGWALYEWARNPHYTLVLIFLFAPYFSTALAGDAVIGQVAWGYLQAATGAVVAVSAPLLGAMADGSGRRKPWVLTSTALALPGLALLWLAVPGASLVAVGIAVASATIALEVATVFHNAMLPRLAAPGRIGWLSGVGFALGNVGGIVLLLVVLAAFVLPAQPAMGVDRAQHEIERLVGPLAALWLAVFTLPFVLVTPDAGSTPVPVRAAFRRGVQTLTATLRQARAHRASFLFLLARMIYNDGMLALQQFGGIYGAGVFGWKATELGLFGILLILSAAAGGLIGGWLDDHIGSRRLILISLLGLAAAVILTVSLAPDSMLFGAVGLPLDRVDGPFGSAAERWFLALAAAAGLLFGPCFASSRTLAARLAPPGMSAEYFGLYALSGTITAFLGPLAIALATAAFASQRAGLGAVVVFLLGGWVLLARLTAR